jgi:hypothetical protein
MAAMEGTGVVKLGNLTIYACWKHYNSKPETDWWEVRFDRSSLPPDQAAKIEVLKHNAVRLDFAVGAAPTSQFRIIGFRAHDGWIEFSLTKDGR